jgi:hypothetical protein
MGTTAQPITRTNTREIISVLIEYLLLMAGFKSCHRHA